MPDARNDQYEASRDAIAVIRSRAVGLPYLKLAANSVARTQEIRSLGFSEGDARWLSSLPRKTLDVLLPTADTIAIARDNGMSDFAGLVRMIAAQANPPIGVPADFGTGGATQAVRPA